MTYLYLKYFFEFSKMKNEKTKDIYRVALLLYTKALYEDSFYLFKISLILKIEGKNEHFHIAISLT